MFALVTIIDKVMVDEHFRDPLTYSLFIWLWEFIAATAFVVLGGGWQVLTTHTVVTALIAGGLFLLATVLYFLALNEGAAAQISVVAQESACSCCSVGSTPAQRSALREIISWDFCDSCWHRVACIRRQA